MSVRSSVRVAMVGEGVGGREGWGDREGVGSRWRWYVRVGVVSDGVGGWKRQGVVLKGGT